MKKIFNFMVIIFSITMLSFISVNGQPEIQKNKNVQSTNKWIAASTKKFEYLSDFSKVKYKKKIYDVSYELKLLPKDVQATWKAIMEKEQAIQKANACAKKPVIYLYPVQKQTVNIKIQGNINLTSTYPQYDEAGWNVVALPNGTIIDEKTGRQYYCLYWEGMYENKYDMSTGFVVRGENTSKFLEDNLKKLGLTDREANEFIIYWLPQMEKNKYNLVHFATDEYNKEVPLEISPKPDSLIRVLMVYKPLDKPVTVEQQQIVTPKREGFTVVEWGGTETK